MPQFAANLTMLFNEHEFLDRFAAAAKAGFKAVEFLFPYAYPLAELQQRLKANGLKLVLHNLPAGNWDAGDRGLACDPARIDEFRAGVARGIEYGTALGVPHLNCLAGKAPAGVDAAALRSTFVANLRYAAAEFKKAKLNLLIEPINRFDIPGFYLNTTAQAISILDEVGADNAYVQYDIYHAQRMEGELANTMSAQLARIGHIQLADNPGRNEPGTGEIHYNRVLKEAYDLGYRDFVGLECRPKGAELAAAKGVAAADVW